MGADATICVPTTSDSTSKLTSSDVSHLDPPTLLFPSFFGARKRKSLSDFAANYT